TLTLDPLPFSLTRRGYQSSAVRDEAAESRAAVSPLGNITASKTPDTLIVESIPLPHVACPHSLHPQSAETRALCRSTDPSASQRCHRFGAYRSLPAHDQ